MVGNFGYQSNDLRRLVNWPSRAWSFGPSFDWQIFNAGSTFSNIEVQKALQEQAVIAYAKAVLTALSDVETSTVAYTNEYDHRSALSDAVKHNSDALKYATDLYRGGLTAFINVLNAEQSLYGAEDALSQSNTALSTDLVSIYKALGGGWDENSQTPTTSPASLVWPNNKVSAVSQFLSPESQSYSSASRPAPESQPAFDPNELLSPAGQPASMPAAPEKPASAPRPQDL
jgi:hypothetical protein